MPPFRLRRVLLPMTRDFLFANAATRSSPPCWPMSAAVVTRRSADAAVAYAGVQGSTIEHVAGAFTKPADTYWKRR